MASSQNYFVESGGMLSAQISPGIVEEMAECGYERLTARRVEGPYSNVRIGMTLSALEQAGFVEGQGKSSGVKRYEITSDLESAIPDAEEAYAQRIVETLSEENWGFENIKNDLTGKGIKTREKSHQTVIPQYRDDYHQDTLEFLESIRIIDSLEEREIVSNQTDHTLVEQNIENYIEKAE